MDFNRANATFIRAEDRQQVLAQFGLAQVEPLAVGTEAEVYEYDHAILLKLYADPRRRSHLETLRNLYNNVDTVKSGLRLPRIHDIIQSGNLIAVIESRLEGDPLENRLPDLAGSQLDRAETLYLDAVWKLKDVELKQMPQTYLLFDDKRVSEVATGPFESFYAGLLEQKIARVGRYFQPACPAFADKSTALVNALRTGENAPLSLVHGDFFPGNVLVNENLDRVTGVIDFGAFTLFGNTLLDIAGAFGFYRMYDPDRASIRERMLGKIRDRLSAGEHPVFFQFLLAHAILTSDLYATAPDPLTDDHFQWAAEIVAEERYWDRAL